MHFTSIYREFPRCIFHPEPRWDADVFSILIPRFWNIEIENLPDFTKWVLEFNSEKLIETLSKFKIEFRSLCYSVVSYKNIYEPPVICTMTPRASNNNEDIFPTLSELQAELWLLCYLTGWQEAFEECFVLSRRVKYVSLSYNFA